MTMGFPVALDRSHASALERGEPSVSCALFSLPVSSQRWVNMCLVILTVAVVLFASMLVSLARVPGVGEVEVLPTTTRSKMSIMLSSVRS
jgi:hypothetical protein